MQGNSNQQMQQQPLPRPAPMPVAGGSGGQQQRQAAMGGVLPQTFVPAHSSLTSQMMQQPMAGLPSVTPAAFQNLNQPQQKNTGKPSQLSYFDQNASQLVPQTSLTDECPLHPGHMIMFHTLDSDGNEKGYCEKCYAEMGHNSSIHVPQNPKAKEISPEDLISRLQAPIHNEPEVELSQTDKVIDLHRKIEGLCQNLLAKIEKKNEGLILNHEHFGLYESTLQKKYEPVFQQMRQIINEKRLEYTLYLKRQLSKNADRISEEKSALDKFQQSIQGVSEVLKTELEDQLEQIKKKDEQSQRIIEQSQKQNSEEGADSKKKEEQKTSEEEEIFVDSYKIQAITTILDDFENLMSKNFCQFVDYEDFSFAKSRSTEILIDRFAEYFDTHFQGDFRVKAYFNSFVLPRLYYSQGGSKFVYSIKVLNNIRSGLLLQNSFNIPDRSRSLVTPDGRLHIIGGFLPQHLGSFSKNNFVLDEHRSILVAKKQMAKGRCDHALHFFNWNVYVLGGMAKKSTENGDSNDLESLTSCEMYDIKEDKWSEIPSFAHPRQQHSVCHFNEQFIFIFGGKCVKSDAELVKLDMKNSASGGGSSSKIQQYSFYEPFTIVSEVEVYEMAKKTWKTINYIGESSRLAVISPGSMQIAGSQILIFGGLIPHSTSGDKDQNPDQDASTTTDNLKTFDVFDSGTALTMTTNSLILDVTVGSIKYGPELATPTYFISGGYLLPHQNEIHALGLSLPSYQTQQTGVSGAAAALAAETLAASKANNNSTADEKRMQLNFNDIDRKKV